MGLDVRKYKFLQIVRIDAVLAAEPGSPHTVNAALVKSPFNDWLLLIPAIGMHHQGTSAVGTF